MRSSKLIEKGFILTIILSFFFTFGCMQNAFNNPIDSFLGNPTDIDPDLFGPTEEEENVEYDDADYKVVGSEGTYDKSSGIATFSWILHTQEGEEPPLQKIACVKPTELPERFWEDYDSGEPIMDRERVDKQWRNLYIPLDEYGIPQFSMKTRIPGDYTFEVCGILDNDYSNEKNYSGDGTITIEVPDQGLVVVSTECKDISLGEKSYYRKCRWNMEFANGTAFDCWKGRPFTDMNTTDGQTKEGMFEILVEKAGTKEYFVVDAPMRICGVGACGCGNGPYITVTVSEEVSATVSIVKVNEDYYSYTGDGDPIVATYAGQ